MATSVVSKPQALPGCCFMCGSGSRDYYVDTGRSIEFHGAVYFCSECLQEIANGLDFSSPDLTRKLKNKIDSLETENFDLRKKLDGLEEALHGLRIAYGDGMPIPIISGIPNDSNIQNAEELHGGEEDLGSGEGEASESGHDEGVAELPADEHHQSDFSLELS